MGILKIHSSKPQHNRRGLQLEILIQKYKLHNDGRSKEQNFKAARKLLFQGAIEISSATAFTPIPRIYLVAAVQAPATPRSNNLRSKKNEKTMTYICSK